MKIKEIINEASYPGNLGMIEMFKFYNVATDNQKTIMKQFIDKKQFKKAWDLLQQVTGLKLHSL